MLKDLVFTLFIFFVTILLSTCKSIINLNAVGDLEKGWDTTIHSRFIGTYKNFSDQEKGILLDGIELDYDSSFEVYKLSNHNFMKDVYKGDWEVHGDTVTLHYQKNPEDSSIEAGESYILCRRNLYRISAKSHGLEKYKKNKFTSIKKHRDSSRSWVKYIHINKPCDIPFFERLFGP